ncbi:PAS domain-containing protein [Prosthecochloris sp. SCSIO W1101]|uniref:PAS domain-containing protein n=1 Tax=Prosthecochloris sp. SCSIO W1101 TaxID=2992242 RepID=UPI00223E6F55|nr:PAS domain-containing protein [Prosthecochloris sp. SCSIO W1101]UZJ41189.1 PAS domain-containing protein [Prosthecochloris sp. SCSIO W1101]
MKIYKDFNYRLREYILKKHGSISAFCRATGIKYPAQMGPYLKGKSIPGKKLLAKLEKDGADIDWIMHGKRNTLISGLGAHLMTSSYKLEMERIMRRLQLLYQQLDATHSTQFDAYAVINCNLILDEFTRSFEKFLGYNNNALQGIYFLDLIHPNERAYVHNYVFIEKEENSKCELSSRFKSANNHYIEVEWSAYGNNITKDCKEHREYVIVARKSLNTTTNK